MLEYLSSSYMMGRAMNKFLNWRRRLATVCVAALMICVCIFPLSVWSADPQPAANSGVVSVVATTSVPAHGQDNAANVRQRWLLGGLMLVLIVIAVWYLRSRKQSAGERE
jgi:hypothetical protein